MSARAWILCMVRIGGMPALAMLTALAGLVLASSRSLAFHPAVQRESAEVRVLHGVAGAGPLDIYVDGSIALIGIVFGETSGVLLLPGGENEFAVAPSGSAIDAALAAGTIDLAEGGGYYAALLGVVDAASVGLFAIDERPLDQGLARFRIISGASDVAAFVPVFAGGDALSEPLGFGDASEYATLDAGTYDLDLIDTESGVSLLALPATVFAEGVTTDVILMGQAADGTLTASIEAVPVDVVRAVGQVAQIVPGTCSDAGDPIVNLGQIQAGQGETVGVAAGSPVAQGFGLAGLAFNVLLGAPHSVVITDSDGEPGEFTACGEIGGQLTDTGAIVISLMPGDTGTATGIAVLAPGLENPETTGVSVFLTGVPAGAPPPAAQPTNG